MSQYQMKLNYPVGSGYPSLGSSYTPNWQQASRIANYVSHNQPQQDKLEKIINDILTSSKTINQYCILNKLEDDTGFYFNNNYATGTNTYGAIISITDLTTNQNIEPTTQPTIVTDVTTGQIQILYEYGPNQLLFFQIIMSLTPNLTVIFNANGSSKTE